MDQYIWAKAHPGQRAPKREITLYSDIAHRAARKKRKTDSMTPDQIKGYIKSKL